MFNSSMISGHSQAANIHFLWHSSKNRRFLISQESQLRNMTASEKVRYLTHKSFRQKVHHDLAQTMDRVSSSLDSTTLKGKEKEKIEFLATFFFEKISPLQRKIYSRRISEQLMKDLKGKVSERFPHSDFSYPKIFHERLEEAKFWALLGNLEHPKNSCTGSVKVIRGAIHHRSFRGKLLHSKGKKENQPIAIFKSRSGDTLFTSQKVMLALSKAPLTHQVLGNISHVKGGESYINEEASFEMGKHLTDVVREVAKKGTRQQKQLFSDSFYFVPETHAVHLVGLDRQQDKGSLQLWIQEKAVDADEFLGIDKHGKPLVPPEEVAVRMEKIPKELIDLMVIYDVYSGNQDRHAKNWKIILNEKDEVIGLRMIDGGWSMPIAHPKASYLHELNNMYRWRTLPGMDRPFTEFGRKVISQLRSQHPALASKIQKLYQDHASEKSQPMIAPKIDKMGERLSILENGALKGTTLQGVGRVRTHKQVQKFLQIG